MINPNWRENMNGVTVSLGGVVVGKVESLTAAVDPERIKQRDEAINTRFRGSIELELKDAVINPDILTHLMGQNKKVDVETKRYTKGAPPWKLRSKKKRLRKKWDKKYPVVTTIYHNCEITEVEE